MYCFHLHQTQKAEILLLFATIGQPLDKGKVSTNATQRHIREEKICCIKFANIGRNSKVTFTGDDFDDMVFFAMLIDVTIFVQYFVNIVIAILGRSRG